MRVDLIFKKISIFDSNWVTFSSFSTRLPCLDWFGRIVTLCFSSRPTRVRDIALDALEVKNHSKAITAKQFIGKAVPYFLTTAGKWLSIHKLCELAERFDKKTSYSKPFTASFPAQKVSHRTASHWSSPLLSMPLTSEPTTMAPKFDLQESTVSANEIEISFQEQPAGIEREVNCEKEAAQDLHPDHSQEAVLPMISHVEEPEAQQGQPMQANEPVLTEDLQANESVLTEDLSEQDKGLDEAEKTCMMSVRAFVKNNWDSWEKDETLYIKKKAACDLKGSLLEHQKRVYVLFKTLLGEGAFKKVREGGILHRSGKVEKVAISKLKLLDDSFKKSADNEIHFLNLLKGEPHIAETHDIIRYESLKEINESGTTVIQKIPKAAIIQKIYPMNIVEYYNKVLLTAADPNQKILELMNGIIEAVKVLRKREILHNDFKMTNFLVEETGEGITVIVIDFGNASDGSQEHPIPLIEVVNSAPELYPIKNGKNQQEPTEKNEVWCLGMIFYSLWFGVRPAWETEMEKALKDYNNTAKNSTEEISKIIGKHWRVMFGKYINQKGGIDDSKPKIEQLILKMLWPNAKTRLSFEQVWQEMKKITISPPIS